MKKREVFGCILFGLLTALGLRCFYGNAGSDALLWILAPTAWWTQILGGPAFLYEPGVGYVNHEIRDIIAPSCAGVRFLTLSLAMLIVIFVPSQKSRRQGYAWTILSIPGAWLFTGIVNGLRMVLSIYLPKLFQGLGLMDGWLTWERLHTIIGTSVYFTALLILYQVGAWISRRMGGRECSRLGGAGVPALWYFLVVLGIPFVRRALAGNYQGFGAYAGVILTVCLSILCLTRIGGALGRGWRRQKTK